MVYFNFCVAQDSLVYHCDTQQYAGMVFLTPDAPPESGTSFYRSILTGKTRFEKMGKIMEQKNMILLSKMEIIMIKLNLN